MLFSLTFQMKCKYKELITFIDEELSYVTPSNNFVRAGMSVIILFFHESLLISTG